MTVTALVLPALFPGAAAQPAEDRWEQMRKRMVRQQIEARGIQSEAVLDALRRVPRERFVPAEVREFATDDTALPIGFDQTISQPYIVAFMTELLELERHHKVLEIGTGSGYQAAILASLSDSVYSIEIVPELAARAARALTELGYAHATVEQGDGYQGWAEHAPFDRIIVTAAPPEVPNALVEQLAADGRMVVPVGPTNGTQSLTLLTKDARGKLRRQRRLAVRFVPMVRVTDRN
jgi:protein-L-isoaspartate(D-aspartate) O-methyltransferase